MNYLSFDVGIKNLAYCILTPEKKIHDWGIINSLDEKLPSLSNLTVKIKEYEGELIFLHKIVEGFSNHSFGIKVAKLAGIPNIVTHRASEILKGLEKNSEFKVTRNDRMSLAAQIEEKQNPRDVKQSGMETLLQSLNLDDISPKEALHLLYKIQREFKS